MDGFQSLQDKSPEVPPPSYNSLGESRAVPFIPNPDSSTLFPSSFNFYWKKDWSARLTLGEHEDQPLYDVELHQSGLTGRTDIVLHSGPSLEAPALAEIKDRKFVFKLESVITVPGTDINEVMKLRQGFKHETFNFEMDIGYGKERRREQFEWRSSHGREVKELGKHAWGWKLVWLSGPNAGPSSSGDDRPLGQTSDGHEVLAVLAESSRWHLGKVVKFQFVGSGLGGALGQDWALVAVITALRVYNLVLQANRISASTASSSAVAAAIS